MKLTKRQIEVIVDSILTNIKEKNSIKREEFLNNLNPELNATLTEVSTIITKIEELEQRLEDINLNSNLELPTYNITRLDAWKNGLVDKYAKISTPTHLKIEKEVILATIDFEGSIDDFISSIADKLSND